MINAVVAIAAGACFILGVALFVGWAWDRYFRAGDWPAGED